MNNSKKTSSIPLTASDCFILALEKHDHHSGTSGNTCRYVLELEGRLNVEDLKNKIRKNIGSQQLSSFYIHKGGLFAAPKWKSNSEAAIEVNIHADDSFLPELILNKKFSADKAPLFSFDIIQRSNGNSTFIFSWNHLLMDGYGAVLYLKQLNGSGKEKSFISEEEKITFNFSSLKEVVKAKSFLTASSKNPTSGISPKTDHVQVNQKIKVLRFTKEETEQADLNAPKLGAKFGRSPFYLACSARGVKEILNRRKSSVSNFWIPVPQNKRKKGAMGPLLGNHLSFLFYRLNDTLLESIEQSVRSINDQMVEQVRKGIPKSYDVLMNFLKRIPSSLYYQLIKGPQGGSLSGFLFTVAEDHPSELLKFAGLNVLDAFSLPPNTYPPGLTFAFMRFKERLQLMILYYDEVLSEKEVEHLENQIKYELINGKPLKE
ncbi:MAG: hypothetical protein ACT4ON_02060 [Bacteroidota bacterium]